MVDCYQYTEKWAQKLGNNGQKYVNFQTEQGGELDQPDWIFGPRYKKCTLALINILLCQLTKISN